MVPSLDTPIEGKKGSLSCQMPRLHYTRRKTSNDRVQVEKVERLADLRRSASDQEVGGAQEANSTDPERCFCRGNTLFFESFLRPISFVI